MVFILTLVNQITRYNIILMHMCGEGGRKQSPIIVDFWALFLFPHQQSFTSKFVDHIVRLLQACLVSPFTAILALTIAFSKSYSNTNYKFGGGGGRWLCGNSPCTPVPPQLRSHRGDISGVCSSRNSSGAQRYFPRGTAHCRFSEDPDDWCDLEKSVRV